MAFPGDAWRNPTRIVVCETGSTWAVAMRKWVDDCDRSATVIETRTLAACDDQIRSGKRLLTLVCWRPDSAKEQLRWIWRACREEHQPRVVLVQIDASAPQAWLARELGVARTLETIREIHTASSWLMQTLNDQTPRKFKTIREEVFAGLPWASHRP